MARMSFRELIGHQVRKVRDLGRRHRRANAGTYESESLEIRRLPSAIGLWGESGTLQIRGTDRHDSIRVTMTDSDQVRIESSIDGQLHQVRHFDAAAIRGIHFEGRDGNDRFVNDTAIRSTALGGAGSDRLIGGSARDLLNGNDGDDTVYGRGGDDRIQGGRGADRLVGGSGNDRLGGGSGHDYLSGGGGADQVYGHNGRDRLYGHGPLTARSTADSVVGGNGEDSLEGVGFLVGCSPSPGTGDSFSSGNSQLVFDTSTTGRLIAADGSETTYTNITTRTQSLGNREYQPPASIMAWNSGRCFVYFDGEYA